MYCRSKPSVIPSPLFAIILWATTIIIISSLIIILTINSSSPTASSIIIILLSSTWPTMIIPSTSISIISRVSLTFSLTFSIAFQPISISTSFSISTLIASCSTTPAVGLGLRWSLTRCCLGTLLSEMSSLKTGCQTWVLVSVTRCHLESVRSIAPFFNRLS